VKRLPVLAAPEAPRLVEERPARRSGPRDWAWQLKHAVTSLEGLERALMLTDEEREGARRALEGGFPMRVTPYYLGLASKTDPACPIRRQAVPHAREAERVPGDLEDPLGEVAHEVAPHLVQRYPDRCLLLATDRCAVYCRFCTRSYAVGVDTEEVEKVSLKANEARWKQAFEYIKSRPELEDIVISGGDAYQLRAQQLEEIGNALLDMPNVRRMRFASKGPAVMPMKLITDDAWADALTRIVERGRKLHKEVVLHTHFNHPKEITEITKRAMDKLMERGITVRDQTVLQRGVNDTPETMSLLVKRLGHVNVHPYYVYLHDLVHGVEDLRTSLDTALFIEKHVRGSTAGFNTPVFVVDAPGGGGKIPVQPQYLLRYDEEKGRAVLRNFQDKIYEYLEPGYLRDEIRPPAPRPQESEKPAAEPAPAAEVKPPVVGKSRWVRKGATARREKK